MYYFIPDNLNIDGLLKINPPAFKLGYHKDCFIYLLGQITEVAARYRDSVDEKGFVPLNAKMLKQRVHNYNEYMDYLIKHNIIERNGYIPGEKSFGYRFTEKYFSMPVTIVEIKKRPLIKSIKAESNYERNMRVKYDYLHRWFNEDFKIDFEPAVEKLELIKLEEILRCKWNPFLKFNSNMVNAMRMRDHDYNFRIDEKAGRLHTNLTSLKKQIRPYLTYDGTPLASIDIVCAQPTLLLTLFDPKFYEKSENGRICYNDIRGSIREEIDFNEVWKHINSGYVDFELFKEDVMNDFYESFKKKIEKQIGKYDLVRDDLKVAVYKVLYSENEYFDQKRAWLKRIFCEIYPGVYNTLCAFKTKGVGALPILLQNLEAQVVLDRVAKTISKMNPRMPIFTIHDSIVVPATEVEWCNDIFKKEYYKALGVNPNLKTEYFEQQLKGTL